VNPSDPVATSPRTGVPPSQSGFVLLAALGLMSFILLLILSLILQTQAEMRAVSAAKARLLAKENARLGLMIALGELQKHAGPDQRVTARAEVVTGDSKSENAMWTGVWDASSGTPAEPVWLVSGQNPNPAAAFSNSESVVLAPATTNEAAVRAGRLPILGKEGNRAGDFAYWVEDQSVKATITRTDQTNQMSFLAGDADRIQDMRESLSQYPSPDYIFEEINPRDEDGARPPIAPSQIENFARAQTFEQVALTLPDGGNVDYGNFDSPGAYAGDLRHHFTVDAHGVLENPINGGLKVNLTGRTKEELADIMLQPGYENDFYLKGDHHLYHNLDPQTGLPFSENANPNVVDPAQGSMTSAGELALVPAADFYAFRASVTDPQDKNMQVVRNVMPVVSEMSFRLGAFHTGGTDKKPGDAKHRIRFHVDVEFWNPYPFPIRMAREAEDRCFIAMLVPSEMGDTPSEREKLILSVERWIGFGPFATVDWGIHTNLLDFDERLNNPGDNTLNETVMSSWMVIDDVVLQPGEVYHATTEKEDGLARIQGGYVFIPGGDREDPESYQVDPEGKYIKHSREFVDNPSHPVLSAGDQIRISLRLPKNGLTMRLMAFNNATLNSSNSPLYEDNESSWATPLFELRHLYKENNPPPLTLRGDEYSRSTSGSYTINNYNIGFHYRLADELVIGADPDAVDLALRFDLRQPVWDYENPLVQQLVDITEENPFAVSQLGNIFDGSDVIADGQDDGIDSHDGTYETVFLYHMPFGEPLSVGSFHRIPLSYQTANYDLNDDGTNEEVQARVGMPWGGALNQVFDKYFYTGAPDTSWDLDQPLPLATEILNGITAERMRESDAAAQLLIKGSFNLNSLSGPAWAAVLGRSIHGWQYGSSDALNLRNVFFNLSKSTDDAIKAIDGLSEDRELIEFDVASDAESAGRLAMRHPLRRLTDQQIYNPDSASDADDSLVEFLLRELSDYFLNHPPFPSVAAFVDSGILDKAIRQSGINGNVARHAPAYISQANILEPLAPYLTVSSDTFVIRSAGTRTDPATGNKTSQIICEAVVQRLPDRVDGDASRISENASSNKNTFGRKFVIRSIQWKENL